MFVPPDRAAIASVAFHPTDNVLLIATSNKLYFWKWDQPQPFACLQTNHVEEKVRCVIISTRCSYCNKIMIDTVDLNCLSRVALNKLLSFS